MKAFLLFSLIMLSVPGFAKNPINSENNKYEDPETLIKDLYSVVSTQKGEQVDWNVVRSMFIEEAVILLRTKRDSSTQFTVEEFINDFKHFYSNTPAKDSGFVERILEIKSTVYKDIAFFSTVYEALIPGVMKNPSRGVDFWILQKFEDYWKIVAVTNEYVSKEEELPLY